jgi:hypothetical protein
MFSIQGFLTCQSKLRFVLESALYLKYLLFCDLLLRGDMRYSFPAIFIYAMAKIRNLQ